MRLLTFVFLCFAIVITSCSVTVNAQDNLSSPSGQAPGIDAGPRILNCPADDSIPFSVIAPSCGITGSRTVRAPGGATFTRGFIRFQSSFAEYSMPAYSGVFRDVVFTSCSSSNPDYHIVAKELRLINGNKLSGKQVSLFLGNFKVLTLPSMKLRISGRSATSSIFPRPGFEEEDGFSLSQDLRFVDKDQWRANADLKLTANHGVQGSIYSNYGLNGDLSDPPGRVFSYDSLRSSVLGMPPILAENCFPESLQNPASASLRGFGVVSLRQRAFDIRLKNLVVYRQPEIGMNYRGKQFSLTKTALDPRLEIYPEILGSWGRFRETPGLDRYTNRDTLSFVAGINLIDLGPRTSVQPLLLYNLSKYSTGTNYQVSSFGLDISHVWKNNSIASIRYVNRDEDGTTPFQFDNVDINQEIKGEFQVQLKKYMLGYAIGYNADSGRVYDWEMMFGWRTDCLASWFRYNQRLDRFVFDVSVLNF